MMKARQTAGDGGFPWPPGKRVAVSLSFDDARPSQLDAGIPVLDRHGVKGTFYLSLSRLADRLDHWRQAAAAGHEMGNHSLNHACSGNFGWKSRHVLEDYALDEMEAELVEANRRLTDLFGQAPKTFAYPCGMTFVGRGEGCRSYVPAVARHFLAGRGFRDEFVNDPHFCDLAKLGGTELDGVSFEALVAITIQAASRGCWVVFAGHDVASEPRRQVVLADDLDRYCAWCTDPANGVWIETVATVGAHVRQTRGW